MAETKTRDVAKTYFRLKPATAHEREICFLAAQPAALAGCVCGDFGRTGTQFQTRWLPHTQSLVTEGFSQELQNLVRGLKEMKLLAGLAEMKRACCKYPGAAFGNGRREYIFRMDTAQTLCLLRCVPRQGEDNFYLYAYDKKALKEKRERHG